jgi:hypothetical protein
MPNLFPNYYRINKHTLATIIAQIGNPLMNKKHTLDVCDYFRCH